jgi:hypothetical protein
VNQSNDMIKLFFKTKQRISKLSLISIEALSNLGVKFDELPKLPSAMNVEWFVLLSGMFCFEYLLSNLVMYTSEGLIRI